MGELKVKVISLPYIFKVLYVLCFTWTRYQGPVVQSIGSLTTSLRRQLVKYIQTTLSNTQLFFVGKM